MPICRDCIDVNRLRMRYLEFFSVGLSCYFMTIRYGDRAVISLLLKLSLIRWFDSAVFSIPVTIEVDI